ncbi:MAG: TraX family protein [Oscillospiraceae bacterium]|nr:TraX family protein [Oscillospiraceae bacterium]MDD4412992.1 TraX family protein [Oscillospiraceae bacterium]
MVINMPNLFQQQHQGFLSSFSLKWIAIISMTVDHIGALVIPKDYSLIFRCFGRIAFPIFCFLIVEGCFHTHNLKRYIFRLFAFALISEIPFDLAFSRVIFSTKKQNVFFTLLIGLVMITLTDRAFENLREIEKARKGKRAGSFFYKFLYLIICFFFLSGGLAASILLRVDYTLIGVLTIMALYIFRKYTVFGMLSIMLINVLLGNIIQSLAIFSVIPIMLYNGEKGHRMKWLFYLFYPCHLLILVLLRYLLK